MRFKKGKIMTTNKEKLAYYKAESESENAFLKFREAADAYINSVPEGEKLLYWSEHALVRYFERVEGHKFPDEISYSDALKDPTLDFNKAFGFISIEDQIKAIRSMSPILYVGRYKLIIKGLTVLSIMLRRNILAD